MKILIKILACGLLLYNGTGALYGGYNLMAFPDGSSLSMSADYLKNSPFETYLIPGIILFLFNGLLSIFTFITVLAKWKYSALMLMVQGVILSGWIFIQVIMIQQLIGLHYLMGGIGLSLIILGWIMYRIDSQQNIIPRKVNNRIDRH